MFSNMFHNRLFSVRQNRLSCLILCAVLLMALSGCSHRDSQTHLMKEYGTSESQARLVKQEHGVSEYVLGNGLRLLVGEDHRAPLVVTQVWYKVGAADEYDGITGISHLLEHMMFKGTEKYSRQDFTDMIKRRGGRNNAFTGGDYTAYYQVFEKRHIETSFQLESDRMVNLLLRQEDLDKEREVVKEERRLRIEDKPHSRLYEKLYSIALDQSPYHHPVIGWMGDIAGITLRDLSDWYRKWYAPNNATVVVVGDVDPEEVLAMTQKYFGAIASSDIAPRKALKERAHEGERRAELVIKAERPHAMIGYTAPRLGHAEKPWHPYALMVLSAILSSNKSMRFHRNLVMGKKVAQSAHTGYSPYYRYDSLFYISAAPALNASMQDLQVAIDEEIGKVQRDLVNEDDLEIVKASLISNEIFSRDSLQRRAYTLGSFATTGIGWEEIYTMRKKIAAVTVEQVREVAQQYLQPHNRTVINLKPKPKPSQAQ